ncbi:endonuclease/exonuclease/phosphatase family protein [Ponticaulis sp.]|uniref:endonuclease/exonuclease/phosphatase family protein n=1 Tax=Ponticaulis sp. TaxID=2020902 RepID=UPI0025F1D41B|nr:endonuclease/exonuclease/phosphatase family protein [Ponticaulis sp.]
MEYYRLRYDFRARIDRARVINNLHRLRDQLTDTIPSKDSDSTLLLATWNIRDFDATKRYGNGSRSKESLWYIAEVISRFDFVAVQEVNRLDEWKQVCRILGDNWDFICTDVTDTRLGGNGERLLYAFDKRKVQFRNIAGEIVLPNSMLISNETAELGDTKMYSGKQFRRSPFLASFQSNWFKFDICTVHIYYGAKSGDKLDQRVEEISRVANYFGKRAEDAEKDGKALILLGDFNIVHPEHKTMKALTDEGFAIPKALDRPSNLDKTKYYDQIAFRAKQGVLDFIDTPSSSTSRSNAGIVELFDSVFRDGDWQEYEDEMKKSSNGKSVVTGENKDHDTLESYFEDWKTFQFSDHKPMWVRISSDGAKDYLDSLT